MIKYIARWHRKNFRIKTKRNKLLDGTKEVSNEQKQNEEDQSGWT